uniref:Uncharacterized protein n=1 Tax=Acrobeloides nanus TaxID=290746 RepID=A0A914DIH1_9BILA
MSEVQPSAIVSTSNYGKITAIHIGTLLCEIVTIILNILLYRSWKYQKHYLKKECGAHIKAIVMFSIFCGLSSLPYQFLLLTYNNENCPILLLVVLALPRVFTVRFEICQYTSMALDRACATLSHPIYHKHIRTTSFKLSMGASLILSTVDSVLYLLHDQWDMTTKSCSLGSGASDISKNYSFAINMICLGVLIACSIFYIHDFFHTNRFSAQIAYKLAMLMLVSFALLFGVTNMISFAGRLTGIDFGSILGNYGDFLMQLNHVVVFFIFTCIVSPRKLNKITNVTISATSHNRNDGNSLTAQGRLPTAGSVRSATNTTTVAKSTTNTKVIATNSCI